jgi:glutamine synthetase
MNDSYKLEYVWLDGGTTPNVRSKTKILSFDDIKNEITLEDCPEWSFDGSSTGQANGDKSDCLLKPVKIFEDPLRSGFSSYIVLCEVFESDGETPHESNNRAKLREVVERYDSHDSWYGFEQEYTLMNSETGRPLGFPDVVNHFPKEQGEFYCGVGADQVQARELVELHLDACLDCGLKVSGINAEVMLGQWEYQIGPLGPLDVSDQMIVSRYLLYRVSELYNVGVTIHPKPVNGNWNGSGCHINFSTKETRAEGGMDVITQICEGLKPLHDLHIENYGEENDQRMTGKLETSDIKEYSYGVSNRSCSIRIPLETSKKGYGYLEDRRPASNVEPYRATATLLNSVGSILSPVLV